MSFIRPEAQATLTRWSGVGIAAGLLSLGLYWLLLGTGLLPVVGGVVATLGTVLAFDQIRRARFLGGSGGAGVVEVTERQITYFTAAGGAAIALDSIEQIEIEVLGGNRREWVFRTSEDDLYVPLNAQGAEALFDTISALPGVSSSEAIKAAATTSSDRFLIWSSNKRRLH